jgi:5-methyltetrahydropteroyltriglutamate--homocysteine methyltransferase
MEQLEELRLQAKLLTLKELEDIGLDFVGDGEQGRTSFFEYLTEQLSGFAYAGSKSFVDGSQYVALRRPVGKVAPREGERLSSEKELEFLKRHTKRPVKVAVISPYFLSNDWQPGGFYNTKDAFIEDMVRVCKEEARRLSGKVDFIQWDDPGMSSLTELSVSDKDANESARLAVDAINEVARSASNALTAFHFCWGNRKGTHRTDGPLARIYPHLVDLKVDALFLELASSRHEDDINVLKEYPSNKIIAGGVIDVKTPDVEPVRVVKKRAKRLLDYLDPPRLFLTTDCGFAPTWDSDNIPRSACLLKLESLVEAARELRLEYGAQ